MTDSTATEAMARPGRGAPLEDLVLAILHEALEDPALPEETKNGLHRMLAGYREHPEQALAEHLGCLRSGFRTGDGQR